MKEESPSQQPTFQCKASIAPLHAGDLFIAERLATEDRPHDDAHRQTEHATLQEVLVPGDAIQVLAAVWIGLAHAHAEVDHVEGVR